MQWSRYGKEADLKRMGLVELTQEEYIAALNKQQSMAKRNRMKVIAFPVMYGGLPDAKIWMPEYLLH